MVWLITRIFEKKFRKQDKICQFLRSGVELSPALRTA